MLAQRPSVQRQVCTGSMHRRVIGTSVGQKGEPVEWARGRAVGKICLGDELGVKPSVKDEAEKTESFLDLLE